MNKTLAIVGAIMAITILATSPSLAAADSVRTIFLGVDVKKQDRPTNFNCPGSTFVDIHVKGNSVYNIPDIGEDTIKTPGGTTLIKVIYDSEISEIESMEFYKGEKFLGMHDEFGGQKDVTIHGNVQSWACQSTSGDFPKGSIRLTIEIGSTQV